MKLNPLMRWLGVAAAVAVAQQAPARGGMGGELASGGPEYGVWTWGDIDTQTVTGSRYRFSADSVIGWQLMTPEERKAYGGKLRSFTAYDACKSYQEDHDKQMTARANAQKTALPEVPTEACERMKAKGFFD